jgi:hypothetical protein
MLCGQAIQHIASMFGISPLVLAQINQVAQDEGMEPGTRLLIPMH